MSTSKNAAWSRSTSPSRCRRRFVHVLGGHFSKRARHVASLFFVVTLFCISCSGTHVYSKHARVPAGKGAITVITQSLACGSLCKRMRKTDKTNL